MTPAPHQRKQGFLDGAAALLFPINWLEPFGLVMIEAMACATPVIAFRAGSVPEVIDDGVTGYIVDSLEEAVRAVGLVGELNRREIRRTFENRFTARRMADAYVDIYHQLAYGFDSATKPIMSDAVPGETFVNGKSAVGHLRPNVMSPVKSGRDKKSAAT